MIVKEIIGIATVIVALFLYLPYLIQTIQGKLTPHPFSWIIWVTLTTIAYIAQISDNAGPGAWMNGAVILICLFIIFFSLKKGFKDISCFDKGIFISGLVAIPVWILTNNPLWSVILVSVINTLAYIPTFRKSYHTPYQEAVYLYGINFFRHGISVIAMYNISIVTSLFPIVLSLNNGALALFLIWRRRALNNQTV